MLCAEYDDESIGIRIKCKRGTFFAFAMMMMMNGWTNIMMMMTNISPHDDVNHESGLQIMIIIIINIKTINCFYVDDDDNYLLA